MRLFYPIKILFFILILPLFVQAQKDTVSAKRTTFKYGGYVKMDMINAWYYNGEVTSTSPIRDFLLPSAIHVGKSKINQNIDFHPFPVAPH